MQQYPVKIKSIQNLTHDVLRIETEKPQGYTFVPRYDFIPGQATNVSINKQGWKSEKRPFTFTSLPMEDHLEFTIKTYPTHKSVTNELLSLKVGDELILNNVFGNIHYAGEGVFIAGGAGVTPFISILRELQTKNALGNNKLIFANKTASDIILRNEFEKMLGKNFTIILSNEKIEGAYYGLITEDIIKEISGGVNQMFYLCGPPAMMKVVEKQLENLHVIPQSIIKEIF